MDKKLTMLMILDGFGKNPNKEGNAIELANTPNIDELMRKNPTTTIYTSGLAVGLPEGQMGNSEVGHMNLGAGRVVYQDLVKINIACREHKLLQNKEIAEKLGCTPNTVVNRKKAIEGSIRKSMIKWAS